MSIVVTTSACRDETRATSEPASSVSTTASSTATPSMASTEALSAGSVVQAVVDAGPPNLPTTKPTSVASATTTATVAPIASANATTSSTIAALPSASTATTPTSIVSTPSTTGAHYAVWMQGPAAKVGVASFVDIVLVPQGGYHCNAEYPHKFKLGAASPGVTYPQPVVTTIAYGVKRTTMRVPFTATTAGTATIGGKFTFAVCTADTCEPGSAPLSITVKVE